MIKISPGEGIPQVKPVEPTDRVKGRPLEPETGDKKEGPKKTRLWNL